MKIFASDFLIVLNNVTSPNMVSRKLLTHESSSNTTKENRLLRLCPQLPRRNCNKRKPDAANV